MFWTGAPIAARYSNGFGTSMSRQNAIVGGAGRERCPAARAAVSSVNTGSVSPIAFANSRNRPASTNAVCGGSSWPMYLRSIIVVSRSASEQRARNQLLHDFVGAAVDALHARVDVHARDGILVHVAVAAEQLQAFVDHAPLQIGGPLLGHRGR